MDIVGFCTIKKDAKCNFALLKPKDWQGKDCAVFEFNPEGDVLALHPSGEAIGMFEKDEILRSFKCGLFGKYIVPPGLNFYEQSAYVAKLMQRKGGYDTLLKNMVIEASLAKGKFCDSFLWQKQNDLNIKL